MDLKPFNSSEIISVLKGIKTRFIDPLKRELLKLFEWSILQPSY